LTPASTPVALPAEQIRAPGNLSTPTHLPFNVNTSHLTPDF
jgi:hypothetical protein